MSGLRIPEEEPQKFDLRLRSSSVWPNGGIRGTRLPVSSVSTLVAFRRRSLRPSDCSDERSLTTLRELPRTASSRPRPSNKSFLYTPVYTQFSHSPAISYPLARLTTPTRSYHNTVDFNAPHPSAPLHPCHLYLSISRLSHTRKKRERTRQKIKNGSKRPGGEAQRRNGLNAERRWSVFLEMFDAVFPTIWLGDFSTWSLPSCVDIVRQCLVSSLMARYAGRAIKPAKSQICTQALLWL